MYRATCKRKLVLTFAQIMMLGRHWESLCAALSQPNAPSAEYDIDLAFPTCSTANRSRYMASTPYSFHCKTQESLLECTQTYLRGVKRLRVYGTTHPHLSDQVQKAVTASPLHPRPQWLSSLSQWTYLAHSLQAQDRHIEAFGLWTVVHQTPSHILHERLDPLSYKRLLFASHFGTALCYLYCLEPKFLQRLTDEQFATISDLAEKGIHAAWKRRTTNTDRAQIFSLKCRLLRLSCQRRNTHAVGYGTVRRMELLLCRAERYHGLEPMVIDERWRLRWWISRVKGGGGSKARSEGRPAMGGAVRWPSREGVEGAG
jgi:hypothetical protein